MTGTRPPRFADLGLLPASPTGHGTSSPWMRFRILQDGCCGGVGGDNLDQAHSAFG
jgi:hypothetical protein